jgi:hypothetical protein
MSVWIVLSVTIALQVYALRRLGFDWFIVALVLAGTALYVDYASYTSIAERNYDGSSHVEYVQALAARFHVPNARACGVCGHPPLYYALAASWSKVLSALGWGAFELGLQWLSLLLSFGFVVFALLILRSRIQRPATLRLAAALVVFWPSSVINSARVHNDALASLLMLAAVYFIAEWDVRGRPRDFYAALGASALSLFTKSSGYAVAATLVFFAALRVHSSASRREALQKCALAVSGLALAAVSVVVLRESHDRSTLCQAVLGNACGERYVPTVPDHWDHFVRFDVLEFLRRPDTVPGDPFPNRFLKSSLFGVMPLGEEFGGARHELLAGVISALLLAMVGFGVAALPSLRGVQLRPYRVYFGATVIWLVFLVAFRIRVPNEFHEDFRHIYPALVPGCLGYALVVERLGSTSKLLGRVGVALALALMGASVAFFLRAP